METTKLFLTDYKSYNEGKQFEFGHWVDLTNFNDASEFMEYVNNHFNEIGIEDPEPMYTDCENLPDFLYSESLSESDLERIYTFIQIDWYNLSINEKICYWNEYCRENSIDSELYDFDKEFFNTYFEGRPMEAARATHFGDLNWNDDYIYFNGYANLESTSNPDNFIYEDELIGWLIDNPNFI